MTSAQSYPTTGCHCLRSLLQGGKGQLRSHGALPQQAIPSPGTTAYLGNAVCWDALSPPASATPKPWLLLPG